MTIPLWAERLTAAPMTAADHAADDAVPRALRADLVVIGLGAAGLQAAAAAAQAGLDVIGVDAGVPGGGASGRNGGFLLAGAADFHHDLAQRLGAAAATQLYRCTQAELERQLTLTPAAVHRVGSIRLAVSPGELEDCREQARVMRRDGIDVGEVTGPFGSGLYFPGDATMHPGQRCAVLVTQARRAGVRIVSGTPVRHVGDGQVRGHGLRIRAERVLVTVNAGAEQLLPSLQGRLRTARAQMLATRPGLADPPMIPAAMYARHGLDYWQRLPDGRIVLGGARDRGGGDEWTDRPGISDVVQAALERVLQEQVLGPDDGPGSAAGPAAAVTHRWSGRLAFTPDRLPVCEVVAPGVAVAGGYCGTGNVLGPLTARAALGLLLGRRDEWAHLLAGLR